MGYLTQRLLQTVSLLVGFPLSGLLSTHRAPEINSMKCHWIAGLPARRLAACAHITNWEVEPSAGAGASESKLRQQHDSAAAALFGWTAMPNLICPCRKGPLSWKTFCN